MARDELVHHVRLPGRQQLHRLLARDGLLQDHLAGLELARAPLGLALLAEIIVWPLEHASAAQRTLAHRFLAGEIELHRRLLRRFRRAALAGLLLTRRKLEAHLAIFLHHEKRGERPALLRHELRQQVGLFISQQLADLRWLDGELENDFAGAEVARLGRAGGLFADVAHAVLKHASATFGARAERLAAGEIHFRHGAVSIRLVLAEIELGLELRRQLHDGREGPAHLAAETLQRPDDALGEQFLDLLRLELPARGDLPQGEVARGALELLVVLLDDAAALGARRFEFAEVAGHGVVLVALRAADDAPRHLGNLRHELRPAQLPPLDLPQLEFPVARHLRRAQLGNLQPAQERDDRERLGRRLQVAAVAVQILFPDQALDDGRARGRRAETLVCHRRAQLLVLDELAGAFHRGEQRGFVVARGRLRAISVDLNVRGLDRFVWLHQRERRRVFRLQLAAIDGQPAGVDHHLALGLERLALDARDARGHEEFRRRIKHREETLRDEVVKFLLRFAQGLRRDRRGDDGEVVRDFRVVENALVRPHPVALENRVGERAVLRLAQHCQRLLHGAEIILRQRARVGARVGEDLVLLVKRLRQPERVLCGKAEAPIRLALQARQVVEQRRELRGGLAFLGDDAGLAQTLGADGLRARAIPEALGLLIAELVLRVLRVLRAREVLIKPASGIWPRLRVERAVDFPVILRHKLFDPLLALDQHRQRRCLHAADGREMESAGLRVEGRHGARAVDADKPVGLAAAHGGVGQRQHRSIIAQRREAGADSRRRHGLEPEPLDGLLRFRVLDDVAEDEFALAPGVAGVDERGHVLALEEAREHPQARLGFLNRPEVEVRRDDGQMGEAPLAAHRLDALGRADLEQVADGRREHEVVALEILVVLREAAERLRDVTRDRRFFRNDKRFSHVTGGAFTTRLRFGATGSFFSHG